MGRVRRERITTSTDRHTLTTLHRGESAPKWLELPLHPKLLHPRRRKVAREC